MRSAHVLFFLSFLILTAGVCLWLSGCNQEPLSLAPETEFGRWTLITPEITEDFSAVWGAAADDIYATTLSGSIYHFDGTEWLRMNAPGNHGLLDIWGGSAVDIYAVGDDFIFHYDGTAWTKSYERSRRSAGVWGSSASDVYAYGDRETVHFDGSTWRVDSLLSGRRIYSMWGTASSDVFAGTWSNILRFDGSTWTETDLPITGYVSDIWGTDGNDVYAVTSGEDVLHYDGTQWVVVFDELPSNLDSYSPRLWGSATDDVFIFCRYGYIFHYDGVAWNPMVSNTGADLTGAWGSGTGDMVAVGFGGKTIAFDGSQWSSVTSGTPRADYIWGTSPHEIFLGDSYSVYRYDGKHFEELPHYTEPLGTYDVWGTSRNDLFSVGSGGKIFHFDGTSWSLMASDTDQRLNAVWGAGSNDVYAVGDEGTVVHYDGAGWGRVLYDTGRRYTDVWGSSGRDVFVVGYDGMVLHFDGAVWSRQVSGTTYRIWGIWGSSASDVFAVSPNIGWILHYDGDSWGQMYSGVNSLPFSVFSVAGTGPDDVWAVGWWRADHYNGKLWTNDSRTGRYRLSELWASPAGIIYAINFDGSLYVHH